jgi:uncharacterized small protein (DUF1192 family)
MKIVVRGRDFEELTEAALPYVEKHPQLRHRFAWFVDNAPEGGLMATAEIAPPVATPPPAKTWFEERIAADIERYHAQPRRKKRVRLERPLEPLLPAEPPRVVPDPVLIEREVERQLGPLRAEIERLRRDVERASGRVSIDDFDTFASPAGDPPFHGDLVS